MDQVETVVRTKLRRHPWTGNMRELAQCVAEVQTTGTYVPERPDPAVALAIALRNVAGRPAVASHLLPRSDRMSDSISCRRHLHEEKCRSPRRVGARGAQARSQQDLREVLLESIPLESCATVAWGL